MCVVILNFFVSFIIKSPLPPFTKGGTHATDYTKEGTHATDYIKEGIHATDYTKEGTHATGYKRKVYMQLVTQGGVMLLL